MSTLKENDSEEVYSTLNLTPIELGKDNIGQTEYLVRLKLISVQ